MKQLVLYLIIFLTLLAPGYYHGVGLPTIHAGDILIVLAAVALIRRGAGRLFFPPNLRRMTAPYVFVLVYVQLVTVLFAPMFPGPLPGLSASFFATFAMFKPLFLLAVLVGLGLDPSSIRRVGTFVVLLMFAELGLAYFQKLNYLGVNQWLSPLYTIEKLTPGYVAGRYSGSFGNPNDLGTAMSMLATLAYARAIFGPGKAVRVVSGLAAVLTMIALVWIAKTRQGTLCLLGGCFTVQIVAFLRRGRRSWGTVVGLVAFLGLLIGIGVLRTMPFLSERFRIFTTGASIFGEESIMGRFPVWRKMLGDMGGFIFFGKGMVEFVRYGSIDSGYLALLIAGGMPALIGFLLMLAAPFRSALGRLRRNTAAHPDTWLHAASLAIIVPLGLTNLVNHTLTNGRVFSTCAIVYGLSFAVMRARDEEAELVALYDEELETSAYEGALLRGPAG